MTEVPASFGKYYLTEKLAAGGMAEIYLGKLVGPGGFEKHLVIKQIHPRLSGQRHFVDLFVAEAKILVGLVHGNIVPVYELGVIGETYYIAMEYIDGPSLFRLTEQLRLQGGPMAPALAAHIATKILDGLDYAHRKGDGIIHRDLSGRNVMISRDGEVKLVDFGIAVALGEGGDLAGDTPAGSFPYMSPEQVERQPLTGQSDLFSAGILLWEMLTGERLFARTDAAATLAAVTDAEILPPSFHHPAVPARLDEVVMKALHRDLSLRWQSAAEMLAALHRYLYSLEETPGARDLGRLVARYCPPTSRRRLTESDGAASPSPPPAAGGPATAVLPREVRQQSFATHVELAGLLHSSAPGERSAGSAADDELGHLATAVAPRRDEPSGPAEPGTLELGTEATAAPSGERTAAAPTTNEQTAALPARAVAAPAEAAAAPAEADVADAAPIAVPSEAPAYPRATGAVVAEVLARQPEERRPARRRLAVSASLLVIVVAGLATASLLRRGSSQASLALADDAEPIASIASGAGDPLHVERSTEPSLIAAAADGGVPRDARRPLPDARTDARPDARTDARRPELQRIDARTTPFDARPVPTPHDARPPDARLTPAPADARPDARLLPRPDAQRPEPRDPAQIKVGANPWGEVYLDGKLAGRTPMTLTVPPGRHEIEVAFPVGETPRRETYRLDLGAGETRSVLADFTQ